MRNVFKVLIIFLFRRSAITSTQTYSGIWGVIQMKVMVNGLPGKVSTVVAEHVMKADDLVLHPYSLTGQEVEESKINVGGLEISLIKSNEREAFLALGDKPYISVDFTHPSAVNSNAEFYCQNGLPFVMGTTGGDREALEETVRNSDNIAVIAPNMAKQIVAFQAMMKDAADTFPDAFKGYNLEITESHQKGKADTSGTAKAMIGYFNALGIPFTKDEIVMVREPSEQLKMGIPKDALTGHGWHTYTLKSGDNSVFFQFTHNVNGREVYADGTLSGIRYLAQKIQAEEKGKVYSMIDVLKGK
ncbi:MAG: dihydrodipicolinate reductase [Nanoarchaeota archaeon]|nr:dihydrodipicolinate reductase [Nanoarchaeota archaeon]